MFSPVRNIPNVVAHVCSPQTWDHSRNAAKLRPIGAPQQDPDSRREVLKILEL